MPIEREDEAEHQRRLDEERRRIRELVAVIFAQGYFEGMDQVSMRYELDRLIPNAGASMPEKLKIRLQLVEEAVDMYLKLVRKKAVELRGRGMMGNELYAEVAGYARRLATDRSEVISEMEYATGRVQGAGAMLDESGMEYEWRFPHFDLGTNHEECPICEAIRERAPYTTEEAQEEGFPSYPHPGCDHGWVVEPVGEPTRTEEHPADRAWRE